MYRITGSEPVSLLVGWLVNGLWSTPASLIKAMAETLAPTMPSQLTRKSS